MKIERVHIVYKCDECGTEFDEYESMIILTKEKKLSLDERVRVIIQKEIPYVLNYEESTLCDKCKIKFLKKALNELEKKIKIQKQDEGV